MRAAVLGRPVAHSLSPVLHRAAYRALGLPWRYDAMDTGRAELPGFLERVRAEREHWAGLSLTMPLKEAVLPLLDEVRTELGAVNTVLVGPAGLAGDNTDVAGIEAGLAELGAPLSAGAAVLGAGGTARAALAALARAGAPQVTLVVRDPARAEPVADLGRRLGLDVRLSGWGEPPAGLPVLSTVPGGVADGLAASGPVLDVCYAPWPTGYAARAAQAGWAVVGGLTVLVGQAARQVELMTGSPAPWAAMLGAGRGALAATTDRSMSF